MKRMKILMCILLSTVSVSNAQKMKEWVNQKKTQVEYLVLQIAANQVYLEYVKKGYRIARDGLNTISSFKRGEFNLHDAFFQSLKTVNPEVKRYVRIAETVDLQRKIVQEYSKLLKVLTANDAFTVEELDYVRRVFSRLLDDCGLMLDELITVTTNGKLEMKDDERMARIDKLFSDMQDKYTFSQSFSGETKTMAAGRLQEKNDLNTSRALHGIND
ncbi:TerB family tellurite resistance protein [Emticicia sp. 21SJ11W-3]|uniref:TerB family tellurite resistance protein n=1 Tax=Emticicia sp. 21SJ11W-3 TaxID=2916755 RepID=UPI0020A0EF75|nr:TerB family tellurite resistance protein [Emticicia sp. 21SJ11W-3]UTA69034.1 TerB family tellurite resistance protein [Emticicia sp. 21SJ11W-3]